LYVYIENHYNFIMKKYLLILSVLALTGCGSEYKPASFLKQTLSVENSKDRCKVVSRSAVARYVSDGGSSRKSGIIESSAYRQCMYDQGYIK